MSVPGIAPNGPLFQLKLCDAQPDIQRFHRRPDTPIEIQLVAGAMLLASMANRRALGASGPFAPYKA